MREDLFQKSRMQHQEPTNWERPSTNTRLWLGPVADLMGFPGIPEADYTGVYFEYECFGRLPKHHGEIVIELQGERFEQYYDRDGKTCISEVSCYLVAPEYWALQEQPYKDAVAIHGLGRTTSWVA